MQIAHLLRGRSPGNPLSLGIGKFDGFHLGHQRIVQVIKEQSLLADTLSGVFTFRHFPVDFMLCSWEEKISLLRSAGLQWCLWADFEEICHWEPEHFLQCLQNWQVKEIVVGFNFCFGAHRKGTVKFLQKAGSSFGFNVIPVAPIKVGAVVVNSTRIRSALRAGRIEEATQCLGRPFSFEGRVITGCSRGLGLGFPTANLYLSKKIFLPYGVYAAWVPWKGHFYQAAVNIGVCPTFGKNNDESVEVHLLNFNEDLYGKKLQVYLISYLRPEITFSSPEALKNQLAKDVVQVNLILGSHPQFDLSIGQG